MKTMALCGLVMALGAPAALQAQPLFSFESGTEGWQVSGFNARPVTIGTSPNGATHGSQALAVTQTGGGFSWNVLRNNSGQDAFYQAMNAASANEAGYTLELDVTYQDAAIPNGTFLNLSLWINSDAGFRDIHGQALTSTMQDQTVHLSIPFTSFSGTDEIAPNSSFYQLGIGMNGDWGAGDATVYFDNVQIVPEPSTIGLLVLAGVGGLYGVRRRFSR